MNKNIMTYVLIKPSVAMYKINVDTLVSTLNRRGRH